MAQLSTQILFNDIPMPAYGWSVELGTYGQLARATIRTTVSKLSKAKINLKQLAAQSTSPIDVGIMLNGDKVFGGYYHLAHGSLHENEVELVCRDYASVLFDTKRSLADLAQQIAISGFNPAEQDLFALGLLPSPIPSASLTVGQLIAGIGQIGGFASQHLNLNVPPAILSLPVGVTRSDAPTGVLATVPESLWLLLVFIARMTGCTIYTTPDKILTFEDIVLGRNPHAYSWMLTPAQLAQNRPAAPPVLHLDFLHQPTRNKSFSSIATTHDPKTTGTTTANTIVIDGETFNLGGVPRGTYTASAAGQVRGILSARGLSIPIYQSFKNGYNKSDINALSEGNASDIASKLVVWTAVVSGDLSIKPLDQVVISEGVRGAMLGFSGDLFYANSVSHHFNVPQGEAVGHDGFLTTMKLLNIPPPSVSQTQLDNLVNNGGI